VARERLALFRERSVLETAMKRPDLASASLRTALVNIALRKPEERLTDTYRREVAGLLERRIAVLPEDSSERVEALRQLVIVRGQLNMKNWPVAGSHADFARATFQLGRAIHRSVEGRSCYVIAKMRWQFLIDWAQDRGEAVVGLAEATAYLADAYYREDLYELATAEASDALKQLWPLFESDRNNQRYRELLGRSLAVRWWVALEQKKNALALKSIRTWAQITSGDGRSNRIAATAAAQCAAALKYDFALSETDRQELSRSAADLAVQFLDRAVTRGFKDVSDLEQAPELGLLRERDDFQKVLDRARKPARGMN
jgi:hypothetical protein